MASNTDPDPSPESIRDALLDNAARISALVGKIQAATGRESLPATSVSATRSLDAAKQRMRDAISEQEQMLQGIYAEMDAVRDVLESGVESEPNDLVSTEEKTRKLLQNQWPVQLKDAIWRPKSRLIDDVRREIGPENCDGGWSVLLVGRKLLDSINDRRQQTEKIDKLQGELARSRGKTSETETFVGGEATSIARPSVSAPHSSMPSERTLDETLANLASNQEIQALKKRIKEFERREAVLCEKLEGQGLAEQRERSLAQKVAGLKAEIDTMKSRTNLSGPVQNRLKMELEASNNKTRQYQEAFHKTITALYNHQELETENIQPLLDILNIQSQSEQVPIAHRTAHILAVSSVHDGRSVQDLLVDDNKLPALLTLILDAISISRAPRDARTKKSLTEKLLRLYAVLDSLYHGLPHTYILVLKKYLWELSIRCRGVQFGMALSLYASFATNTPSPTLRDFLNQWSATDPTVFERAMILRLKFALSNSSGSQWLVDESGHVEAAAGKPSTSTPELIRAVIEDDRRDSAHQTYYFFEKSISNSIITTVRENRGEELIFVETGGSVELFTEGFEISIKNAEIVARIQKSSLGAPIELGQSAEARYFHTFYYKKIVAAATSSCRTDDVAKTGGDSWGKGATTPPCFPVLL